MARPQPRQVSAEEKQKETEFYRRANDPHVDKRYVGADTIVLHHHQLGEIGTKTEVRRRGKVVSVLYVLPRIHTERLAAFGDVARTRTRSKTKSLRLDSENVFNLEDIFDSMGDEWDDKVVAENVRYLLDREKLLPKGWRVEIPPLSANWTVTGPQDTTDHYDADFIVRSDPRIRRPVVLRSQQVGRDEAVPCQIVQDVDASVWPRPKPNVSCRFTSIVFFSSSTSR